MNFSILRRGFTAFLCSTLLASGAAAQSAGFALNRYEPSERGSDWFWAESLDLRGSARPAIGLIGDFSYKPLVSYDTNGDEVDRIVENQLFAQLGASLVLANRVRFGLNVPLMLLLNGEPGNVGGVAFAAKEGAALGDIRLGADLRLFGEYDDVATVAIGLQAHLPTGSQDAFAGDGKARLVPRLLLAGNASQFAYSVRTGLNIRFKSENFAGDPFGSELIFGGALGVRLADNKLLIGPELFGSTVVSDSGDGLFARRTTPLEGVFGGHYTPGDWRFGLGVGRGLTRGFGSPALRVLLGVEWAPGIKEEPKHEPAPQPEDRDGDGIFDSDDACPDTRGAKSKDPEKNGCPPDRDGDTVLDADDACVDTPGERSTDDKLNGCPPKDTDGDTVLDRDDACPDEPGELSDDKAKHGCPLPKDRDGDGILNEDDACPDRAGTPAKDPKKHGCPKAEITGSQVVILERIEFDTGKATLRPESHDVLSAVLDVLSAHPEITLLSIEGHTDNKGKRTNNIDLSQRRAAAVVKWLIDKGIEANRLASKGLGPDQPVDTNETDAGRQNNRRVEFHILKTKDNRSNE